MKIERKTRISAMVLLLIFLLNILSPTVTYALTDGPTAPQTNSFEEFNATDMVNLLSGDMTYNLPLLNVSSPEGGFPVNLFYHAGIKLNQDASDYGLGWGLNPGSINRSVNGYPDDYRKELMSYNDISPDYRPQTLQAEYADGFKKMGSMFGIPASIGGVSLSIGIEKNQNTGKYGVNQLGITWKGVNSSVGDYGGSVGYGGTNFSLDANRGIPTGSLPSSYNKDTHNNGLVTTTTTSSTYSNGSKTNSSVESWGSIYTKINSRTFLDKKTFIEPYGALYSGHYAPSSYSNSTPNPYVSPFADFTVASDEPTVSTSEMDMVKEINIWSNKNDGQLQHLAYDDYQVNAQGISGQIKPEIYENGSLMGSNQQYEDYMNKNSFSKLPIITATNVMDKSNTNTKETNFGFRYTDEFASNLEMQSGYMNIPGNNNTPNWNTPHDVFPSVESNTANFFDPAPDNLSKGYANHRLKGKRFVEWFTDYDIKHNFGIAPYKYSDGSSPVAKNDIMMNAIQYLNQEPGGFNYSVNNVWAGKFDAVKIKAFKITAEDGTVYHFGLPVYALNEAEIDIPSKWNGADNINPDNSNIVREKKSPYAYTWLLTGITGPDFVDVNHDGITNDGDTGYWVRFDYGKWTDSYEWSAPYDNNTSNFDNDVTFTTKMRSHGQKQLYYLNQIVTRTNTAIFVHNTRLDGKGANILNSGNPKAKQLRTEEIRLLKNEDLRKLVDYYNYKLTSNSGSHSDSKHNYNAIYDIDDIYQNPLIAQRFKDISIKTIKFGYSYDLCKNTPNSDDVNNGKLTLNKITILGKNETSVFPPYVFDYDISNTSKNPNYSDEKYDRWGYYKFDFVNGNSSNRYVTDDVYNGSTITSHGSKNYVDAWSLRNITTPLGANIKVEYESDSYSRNGGSDLGNTVLDANGPFNYGIGPSTYEYQGCFFSSNVLKIYYGPLLTELQYYFNHHIPIKVVTRSDGTVVTSLTDSGCMGSIKPNNSYQYKYLNILAINTSSPTPLVTIDASPMPDLVNLDAQVIGKDVANTIVFDQLHYKYPNIIYGGGVRVKEISTTDESGNVYKTAYDYSYNSTYSSGFTEIEPPHYDKGAPVFSRYAYDPTSAIFDGPSPGVMYSKVAVKTVSAISNDPIKTIEYDFEPFDKAKHFNRIINNPLTYSKEVITHNKLNQVGRLNERKVYGKNNDLLEDTKYNYTDAVGSRQGITKNVVNSVRNVWNFLNLVVGSAFYTNFPYYEGWYLTTNESYSYPNVLVSTTSQKSSVINVSTNTNFDFFTGNVLETQTENSFGEKYKSKILPAYTKYGGVGGMGSKFDDLTNKNMLTQTTGSYTYSTDATGTDKLLSAGIQTWSNLWNYRESSYSDGTYSTILPNNNTYYTSNNAYVPVWRPYQSYVWKSLLNADGTAKTFSDYLWVGASSQDAGWQKTSEITLYNHYSKSLEAKDVNNQYASVKLGFNDAFVFATASNSKYTSMAYSGAEDMVGSGGYFGGEVEGADKRLPNSSFAHTGNYCLKNDPGLDGFKFSGSIGVTPNSDFKKGQKIRSSVWLYNTTIPTTGILGYDLFASGGTTPITSGFVDITSVSTKQVGSKWYLLTLDFTIPSTTTATKLVVKTNNTGTQSAYFDDFRVHPTESVMASNVYEERTGWVMAILDADNFATEYTYDDAGRLTSTIKETMQGSKTVSENTYHYGRLPH